MIILGINGMRALPFVDETIIQDQLFSKVKPPFPQHEFDVMEYDDVDFQKPDIVIGHSLGGDRARLIAAQWKPKALITLDARRMDNWSWTDVAFRWRKPFDAPIPETYNFIHTPNVFFPGYEFKGAKCNEYLVSTHMNICAHPRVAECLTTLIKASE